MVGFNAGRKGKFLDSGGLFTLQTLRSRNQSGALTAFV